MDMQCRLVVLTVLAYFTFYGCHAQSHYEEDECKVWRNVSSYIMQQDKMDVQCAPNSQCIGVDCRGAYKVDGEMLGNIGDVDVCFGIFIHPCNATSDLSVYVDIIEQGIESSFQKRFTDNGTAEIPGSHIDLSMGDAVGLLHVTKVQRMRDGKKYMLAGVEFMIRLSFGGHQFIPDSSKTTLVPDIWIPIPACEASVGSPSHDPGTCSTHFPKNPKSTPAPSPAPPSLPPLPGTACTVNEMDTCRNSEICRSEKGSTKGHCVCSTGAEYNLMEMKCEPKQPATTDIPVFPYPVMDTKKHVNKKVVIIAVCSVVGVLIVAGVMLGLVFRHRARRARYSGHQPLATEDFHDDDDDEPLQI